MSDASPTTGPTGPIGYASLTAIVMALQSHVGLDVASGGPGLADQLASMEAQITSLTASVSQLSTNLAQLNTTFLTFRDS